MKGNIGILYNRMLTNHYIPQVTQMDRVGNTVIFTIKERGEGVYQPRHTDEWIMMERDYYIQYELTPDGFMQRGISTLPLMWLPHCSLERKWGAAKGELRKL
jgi:hypothetical protein